MNKVDKARVCTSVLVVGLVMLVTSFSSTAPSRVTPQLKDPISSLGYFIGDWDCSGNFDSSGKTIEALQHFAPELDGAWMTFRHDDKPPFGYHALAEWGWDVYQKQFVMTVQDSSGGLRLFRSNGWSSGTLQWTGGAAGVPPDSNQRFSFERLDHHFVISTSR